MYLNIARQKSAEGHLPLARQLLEIVLLHLYRGLGPGYYLLSRFWRREVPLSDKLRHLNERDYAREIAKINHPEYQKLSQHKVVEKAMLSLLGIPTPRFLGHLHPETGYTYSGQPLTDVNDLVALLGCGQSAAICLKPVEGWGGEGFEAIEIKHCSSGMILLRRFPDGRFQEPAIYFNGRVDLFNCNAGYIVEEYCDQAGWYKSINPTSLNTIRVYALQSSSGLVRILGGYLRAGRCGSVVDNVSAGGVFSPFDPKTGLLGPVRFDAVDSDFLAFHPDSKVQLEGVQLPGWEQLHELVTATLDSFPQTRFAGVDVAMTEHGPCVIEVNTQPDRTAACDLDIPTIDMLNPEREF